MAFHEPPFSLADEPCRWFSDAVCHRALTDSPRAYLDALAGDLLALSEGQLAAELPPKTLFSDAALPGGGDAGDFRVMPCVVRGEGRITKTVKVIGTNRQRQQVVGRMSVGRALLLDPVENFVAAEFAAFALSSARTGACAALAVRALARSEARTVTVFGAGPVGWYSAFYLAADRPIERLRLIDPDLSRAQAAAFSLREHFPEMPVETMALPPAVDDSATAITATDSRHALLHPANCKASLVVSLGADADCQSELDPAWVGAAALFVDHVDSALLGDLNRWRTMGLIGGDPLPDLPALLARKAVTSALRRVFVSTGSALLDNLTVHYLLEHLGGASDAPSHSG